MILYNCDTCGDGIPCEPDGTPKRIRWQATTLVRKELQFCSLQCASEWAEESGYGDRPVHE